MKLKSQKHAKIGDLLLTFKLLNTVRLSAESKLIYAYLFFHRDDVSGLRVPVLSDSLGITSEQIRSSLKELESTNHVKLITTKQAADMSSLTYYYVIVDPTRYGMLDLEKRQRQAEEKLVSTTVAE
jgi:hypothetical protein